MKYLVAYLVNFAYTVGSFVYNPFDNFRRVTKHKNPLVSLPIWFLIFVYFFLSGFIYRKSSMIAILLFSFFVLIFLIISSIFRKKIIFQEILNVWSFSYLPTLLWFWVNLLLYVFLPPPRSHFFSGYIFAFVYLFFSLLCLYVKIICLFVLFKFVIKLNLTKTIVSMFVIWGVVICLGIVLYHLHLFRIPFI
jgi:hypothetical protein